MWLFTERSANPCSKLIKYLFTNLKYSQHILFIPFTLKKKKKVTTLRKHRLSKPNQFKNTDSTMKLVKDRGRKGSKLYIFN